LTTRRGLVEDEHPFKGEPKRMRPRQLGSLFLIAVLAVSLAGALALSQTAPPENPSGGTSKAAPGEKGKKPAEPEGPKIVRWVCTDPICGGCDGQCSHHGHVATHKDGHCACTPNAGGALDEAIRKAFQGHEKNR
jgi:hypothetical protein